MSDKAETQNDGKGNAFLLRLKTEGYFDQLHERITFDYFVKDEVTGKPVPFLWHECHEDFIERMLDGYLQHLVLEGTKAHMTTFFVLLMFDLCLHVDNCSATVYCKDRQEMAKTLDEKIGFIAEHSPAVKGRLKPKEETIISNAFSFDNSSYISVAKFGYVSSPSKFSLITDSVKASAEMPEEFSWTVTRVLNGNQYGINIVEGRHLQGDNKFNEMIRVAKELEKSGELGPEGLAPSFIAWHQY